MLKAAVLQLLEAAAGWAALAEVSEAAEEKKLRSEVAGRSALLQLLGSSALSELIGAAEEKKLRREVAGRSALLQLLGSSALSELLGAAEAGRFMAP